MTQPATLRQLAGLAETPARLAESVVLVVDAQKEYTEGRLRLAEIDTSIAALAAFLLRARAARTPIIHIVHLGQPGGAIMDPRGPFVEIIAAVKPAAGETVVEKNFPSSFTGTTLQAELEKLGRRELIVAGYMTHMCLNSTVREATEKGYRCTVAADLTTSRDLPDGCGGVVPAALVKSVNLASLADRFAVVVDSSARIV